MTPSIETPSGVAELRWMWMWMCYVCVVICGTVHRTAVRTVPEGASVAGAVPAVRRPRVRHGAVLSARVGPAQPREGVLHARAGVHPEPLAPYPQPYPLPPG